MTSLKSVDQPSTGRVCKKCGVFKEAPHFTPFKSGKNGLYPRCKTCRAPDSKAHWNQKSYKKKILDRAKTRAKKRNIPFNLDLEDIVIPEFCPIFGVRLEGLYCPSIDRIDPTRGYVKGNIQIISNRANMLKNDATVKELRMVADYMEAMKNG